MGFPRLLTTALLLVVAATSLAPQNARGQDSASGTAPHQKFRMMVYYLVLLRSGPNSGAGDSASRARMFAGHMANIRRLGAERSMVVAGPIEDGGDLRGIFVLQARSLDDARRLVKTDPAVQAGEFRPEVYQWYAPSGMRTDASP
jgi:uncharacterized protein YciI